ncbi:competence protein [Thermus scotoductus]|uniref:Competence protein n=2 Tax=Bacteria TaxID=2 RepID=A0A430RPA9_THESC|nr:type 4a pilus biogenesis protein PilO [Thermus scotoductus]RTG96882.1 competence protein [Thermus scotoductus]RTG97765.1 competence protein [Thermus scotoductus]RTG99401.1 competence protein [Thermus scotoductus]RTH03390.1 competence protein [Thermus scotoductus]RTH12680.1 competence protein [Thermus scotoductus]
MLARLGQREWALIAIALTLVVALLWYFLLIVPIRQETESVRQEINALIPERDKGRQAQRALPELRATIAELQAERQAFLRALPKEERLSQVLNEILTEALRSGVTVRSFTRSPTSAPVPEVRAVNLALSLEAPFPETYAYLQRLEGLSRFSSISGLNLSVQGQEVNPSLNTSLTLTLYVLAKDLGQSEGTTKTQATPSPQTGQGGGR